VDRLLELLAAGLIGPITPMHTFAATDIPASMRHLQSANRMGKVVVCIPQNTTELSMTRVMPVISFNSHATYLLIGGLGAMGRSTTTWMVEHGARHFMFLSRSAGRSDKDRAFLAELVSQGCTADAIAASAADVGAVRTAIQKAAWPVKGAFQLSMALSNLAFLDMSHSDWTTGLAAKVDGTWNLHRELPEDIDFLVLASSIGGCFGHIGQANYAAANTFRK
jgi:hypothetical protein